ncbi:porin family protein [Niabella beijingensis]|uniref:porin family protein n=1 Tax=Niabella beijingensis TaxID=2872700 RepID=UPI001CC01AD3|nr:porin family protein [Niabella beijingensis]MBZ4187980.1 PorT family protein [Niabella beijingensis]
MKNALLLTICCSLFGTGLFAQEGIYGRKVRLGFKVDPVFVNALRPLENGIEKDGSGFGVNYGLMADIQFADNRGAFATGLEVQHAVSSLLYNDAGKGLYRDEAAGAAQRYKLKLKYVQIPLSIKLKTNENNGFRWWGQFGTYVGALIGSRLNYSFGNTSDNNINVMSKTNKVNMGLLVGAGGEYRLAEKTDLFFGLGLENGFTDITTNKDWKDDKVVLNRWALRLGVFF